MGGHVTPCVVLLLHYETTLQGLCLVKKEGLGLMVKSLFRVLFDGEGRFRLMFKSQFWVFVSQRKKV